MARTNNSIKFRIGLGFHGQVSRIDSYSEAVHLKHGNIPDYGTAVKYDGNFVVPLTASGDASKIAGFYSRPYTSANTSQLDAVLNADEYNYTGDILKRGYMTVYVTGVVSVKRGDPVYIRTSNPTKDSPLGAVVTSATDAVLLPGAQFMTSADDNGIVEFSYKI